MYSVILSDDHPLLLRGLCELLMCEPGFAIVGSTTRGTEALELIRTHVPSVAVLDIMMPDLGGMAILNAIRATNLGTKVVFLTATISSRQISEALELNIDGLLLKESAPEELIDCLDRVVRGEKWLPADLLARAADEMQGMKRSASASLTSREREIVECLCRGLSNKAIARKLGTTDGTVKVHLHNIYQKLGVPNRTTLAAMALQAYGRST